MARIRAGDNIAKKRRGRPPGSRNSGASTSRVTKREATTNSSSKKRSKAISQKDDGADELSVVVPSQTPSSKPQKRKPDDGVDEIAAEPTKAHKKYVQLETKTKRIPQNIIETWPHLPQQVLEHISIVIKDAKKDIANTQRDERKVMAAQNNLNPLVKKLVHHLAASKIPPQARDYHFDIDKLTERNGQIFRDVTTARHSKQILVEQAKATQKLLTKDEQDLDQLRGDVKKWRTVWKHRQRHGRVHPLLHDNEDPGIDDDGPDDIRLKPATAKQICSLDAPNAELVPILDQLRRSLENMKSNHVQVRGIDQATRDAKTALDDFLFRHTSTQLYTTL
ncbi:hypothetical protein SVAN01_00284 [Stagonosporopsis vannaccii]|nr:hypothetical protein SVAN01_00284 [Stagonosporopsis vannaccii]